MSAKKQKLGELVKAYRLSQLLTQPKLAKKMDLSLSTLVRIEMGEEVSDLTRAKVEQFLKSVETEGQAA